VGEATRFRMNLFTPGLTFIYACPTDSGEQSVAIGVLCYSKCGNLRHLETTIIPPISLSPFRRCQCWSECAYISIDVNDSSCYKCDQPNSLLTPTPKKLQPHLRRLSHHHQLSTYFSLMSSKSSISNSLSMSIRNFDPWRRMSAPCYSPLFLGFIKAHPNL
jgi:hypothetical protein